MILTLIRELAEFERLLPEVTATEEQMRDGLFGARPSAEVVMARIGDEVAGFALYFHNFSTFLAKPGIYLEDLYVRQNFAARGAARRCCGTWRASRSSAAAEGSNGPCSTGISARSTSTRAWAPYR